MYAQSYKNLVVWNKSIDLVQQVYIATALLPKDELYNLVSQMRRAAVSIPSNIAEGYQRRNIREYIQFLSIANASAAELETQIIIVKRLYPAINFKDTEQLLEEVKKMLFVMIKNLNPKR